MRPNIFDIATTELSQDAFITWLLLFADDKYLLGDPHLNRCGKEFIIQLIKKQIPDFNEPITKVNAGRQWCNMDIWAEVNEKYLIIIEDKTYSNQHSDQLKRYKKISEEWCIENKYQEPICIYLKTGNESNISLKNIQDQGFSIFRRIDFKLYLESIGALKNFPLAGTGSNVNNNMLIQNQNNYIQIGGTVLNQEIIK